MIGVTLSAGHRDEELVKSNESNDLEADGWDCCRPFSRGWGEGKEEQSDGLFPFGDGSGKVHEIEFREILYFMDEGGQRGFKFL